MNATTQIAADAGPDDSRSSLMSPSSNGSPSWYLDPLVAAQKRAVHQEWVRRAVNHRQPRRVLKTDLFEEANGADRIFDDLLSGIDLAIGVDIDSDATRRAAARYRGAFHAVNADARALPFPSAFFDVVVSTSTLDHFDSKSELARSLDELARVMQPSGLLVITLDNPHNPLYPILRWVTRRGWTPFALGLTVSLDELTRMLEARGFVIEATEYLLHNPRGLSTVLFLLLRRLLGRAAGTPIRVCLQFFAWWGALPTRRWTGCFVAVTAKAPCQPPPRLMTEVRDTSVTSRSALAESR